MEICFQPGVNLILGENGAGKTSVLEALTIALGDYFNGINGVPKKGISSTAVRFNTHTAGGASTKIEYYSPTEIESRMHLCREVGLGLVQRKDATTQTKTRFTGKALKVYATELCNNMNSILPLLCYFSTQRLAQPKREDFGATSKNELNDRRCGYIGCMDDTLDRKALEAWCLKMELETFKRNTIISEYTVFKEIVATFMMYMNELEEKPKVDYSRQFDDMVYEENGTSVPIKYLSAGYQSLLWIVMTIAFRLCQLNPSVEDYKDVPGIVLIDEVDMHLHPRWQWRIVSALQNTFPKVQFVLATHAPIIISSSKDALLIQIDQDHSINYPHSAYAAAIDDVVELTQGSSSVPMELRKLAKGFEVAFRNGDKSSATSIYSEMLTQFGEDNAEVDLAKRRLSIL